MCFSCNFCFAVLYFLCLSSACLCLNSQVKPSSIRAITLTCFVVCRFGVFSVNWRIWFLLCTSGICFLLFSFVPYFCLSMLQFISKAFLDLCNYPYVILAMPVFGVFLSIGGFGGCHVLFVHAVFYLHRQLTVTNYLHIVFLL